MSNPATYVYDQNGFGTLLSYRYLRFVNASREGNPQEFVTHTHHNIHNWSHGVPRHLDNQGNIGRNNGLRKIHPGICINGGRINRPLHSSLEQGNYTVQDSQGNTSHHILRNNQGP